MIFKNNKLILYKILKVILGDYDIPSLGSRKVSISFCCNISTYYIIKNYELIFIEMKYYLHITCFGKRI